MPTMWTRSNSAGSARTVTATREGVPKRLPGSLRSCPPKRARDFERHVRNPLRGIAMTGQRRRCRHRRQPGRVTEQSGHGVGDERRGQVGVVHDEAAARVDHGERIEPLLAVADRQRHVHRGQADGADLGDRDRAGPADGQVGGGVGKIHPAQVRHRDVRRIVGGGRAKIEHVLRPVRVQHRNTGRGKNFCGAGDGTVDRLRTLGPTEHQQHPGVVGEAEVGARLGAQRRPIQRRDRCPDRNPDHLDVAQSRIRYGGQHASRRAGTDPVGPPRARVGLVDHHRHPAPAHATAGGQIGGQGDIATEADDHVGSDVVEHRTRLPNGPAHPQWEPYQVTRWFPRQRHRGDEFEVVAALGHQPGLQSTLRAKHRDPNARIERHQGIGHGHRRLHVPRGTSTCENDRNPPRSGNPAVASLLPPGSGHCGVIHP
jgi:hypothetical protein